MKWDIWLEGYQAQGNATTAQHLGQHEAPTFLEACKNALKANGFDLRHLDHNRLTWWGCRLYNNETDARSTFG